MTSTARARTPWPVHLVRLLVAVEVVIAGLGLVFLGFLTLLGLSWSLADGDLSVIAVVALVGLIVLLLTFVIRSIGAATRLNRDRARARTTLVRLQWAVLATILLASSVTDGWLGLGFVTTPVPMVTLIGCAGVVLVALQRVPPER